MLKIGNIFLMNTQDIGRLIKRRRDSLSLRQEDLSEMTGVTSKTIYSIENGKGNPSLDILQKILNVLGLEILVQVRKTDE